MDAVRLRRCTPWLLVASLLFGLWTAAVHGEHAGPAAHADACVVCAFSAGLGGGLPAAVAAFAPCAAAAVFAVAAMPAPRPARRTAVRVRGPPSFLA